MTRYWFKPKRYGFGATPVTWQGWALTLGYLVAILVCAAILVSTKQSVGGSLAALVIFVVATAVTFRVSWLKTDGDWRWQWGGDT
jgi:hypothetical protein